MDAPFDIVADTDTPVSAYLKLAPFGPRYLLESVEAGKSLARYSFLGFGEATELLLNEREFLLGDDEIEYPTNQQTLLDGFRRALKTVPVLKPAADLPFVGGLVGVAGYDLVRFFERLPVMAGGPGELPLAAYVTTESLLVFDHFTRRVALLHAGSDDDRRTLRGQVIEALRGPLPAPKPVRFPGGSISASMTRPAYEAGVERAKTYIASGDVYQLVLSSCFSGSGDVDPFDVYRAQRLLNPSPYMFFCEVGNVKLAGSSPEALVKLNKGIASLRPIAGTRPRGAEPNADARLAEELLADPKENAEHVMLVDLARNDLGRVAQTGTVNVNPYRSIEYYSHVMHIVSGVEGTLREDKDAFDLFAAAFPAGTLVGAPKVRAMELIAELEPTNRGLYGGTVGYFDLHGNMDQAIAIRTLVFKEDSYSFQAGAGIVADSDPATEYEEVLAKVAILRRALAIAEEGL